MFCSSQASMASPLFSCVRQISPTHPKLLHFFLFFFGIFNIRFTGSVDSFESVGDLERSIYRVVDASPCVRLLSLSGEIGCSNPGAKKVVSPIVSLKSIGSLGQPHAVLVPLKEMQRFFSRISSDSNFRKEIAGVLIEADAEFKGKLEGFSPDEKFPQAEFASYPNRNYEWNLFGSRILLSYYNFPVFLLSEDGTSALKEAALENEKKERTSSTMVAEFDLVMHTTKSGTLNSESCLREETCLPLGGYSVWSSLPPINASSSEKLSSVILVMASMDSASFFRDKSLGADSPLSGLISLLAAIDSLSAFSGLEELQKQLVFLVFTGEAWGYIGSRRFLFELNLHSDIVSALDGRLIEMVIEIGSVGKASEGSHTNFFAHPVGNDSATRDILRAFENSQDSLEFENIKISTASSSNPGIPPSSMMTFVKMNPGVSGVVVSDFDRAFTNNFYHSHLDDMSNTNSSSIAAAATLVARTIYILATDNSDAAVSTIKANISLVAVSTIKANISLVKELMDCLLTCDPGLSCKLVKSYISPRTVCPNNYVGVVLGEPSKNPDSGYVGDISRFLWNYMADKTAVPNNVVDSFSCPQNCHGMDRVCVKVEVDGKGDCVISNTGYVPAYSTRLKFDSGSWVLLPPNGSDPMGLVDPVWTESNWEEIRLRVYPIHDGSYDLMVFGSGAGLTLISYLLSFLAGHFFTRVMKQE